MIAVVDLSIKTKSDEIIEVPLKQVVTEIHQPQTSEKNDLSDKTSNNINNEKILIDKVNGNFSNKKLIIQ